MTKKMKLVWRLNQLPTVIELGELISNSIITKDEAREILFRSETEEDRDKKSLESEIKFLRELVEKLSQNRSQIITTIREIEVPYKRYRWYEPYWTWCETTDGLTATSTGGTVYMTANAASNFSDIKTF